MSASACRLLLPSLPLLLLLLLLLPPGAARVRRTRLSELPATALSPAAATVLLLRLLCCCCSDLAASSCVNQGAAVVPMLRCIDPELHVGLRITTLSLCTADGFGARVSAHDAESVGGQVRHANVKTVNTCLHGLLNYSQNAEKYSCKFMANSTAHYLLTRAEPPHAAFSTGTILAGSAAACASALICFKTQLSMLLH
jgi:hypothetical protein